MLRVSEQRPSRRIPFKHQGLSTGASCFLLGVRTEAWPCVPGRPFRFGETVAKRLSSQLYPKTQIEFPQTISASSAEPGKVEWNFVVSWASVNLRTFSWRTAPFLGGGGILSKPPGQGHQLGSLHSPLRTLRLAKARV